MEPLNNSEIKKQQLLFTASLFGVVIAVFLFTASFFWAAYIETPWFNSVRQDQKLFETSVKGMSDRIDELLSTLKDYQDINDRGGEKAKEKAREFERKLVELTKEFDQYDSANNDEIKLMKNSMIRVSSMLESHIDNMKTLSEKTNKLTECTTELTKAQKELKECQQNYFGGN